MSKWCSVPTCVLVIFVLFGCGKSAEQPAPAPPPTSAAAPAETLSARPPAAPGSGKVEILFWHTQADENAKVLQEIVDEFNRAHEQIGLTATYVGNYDQIFRKLKASVLAKQLPDLAVAYESMVAEYMQSGVIEPLDTYVNDPEIGLSKESLEDVYPAFIETNRFPQFGNQLLSFPFTKSVLSMYYNERMLREAGFEAPPATWNEFVEQCRAVKAKLGKPGYALSVDPSTVHAMIMSFGGEPVDPETRQNGYASPAAVQALKIIQQLVGEQLAYVIKYNSFDDRVDLASERCAFMIRSSTSRPYLDDMIKDKFPWNMAMIPHGEGQKPVTVLFGANICMFKSTPQRQRAAWEFVKYFCSTEATALWATRTGYMPVRRSATETDTMRTFFAARPQNRRAIELLPFARPEPNLSGVQKVRSLVEKAENDVIFSIRSPEDAAKELAEAVAKALKESQ